MKPEKKRIFFFVLGCVPIAAGVIFLLTRHMVQVEPTVIINGMIEEVALVSGENQVGDGLGIVIPRSSITNATMQKQSVEQHSLPHRKEDSLLF